jgi:hypothetical protein
MERRTGAGRQGNQYARPPVLVESSAPGCEVSDTGGGTGAEREERIKAEEIRSRQIWAVGWPTPSGHR